MISDEMIERAAKAILLEQVKIGHCDEDVNWHSFIEEAKAALEAALPPDADVAGVVERLRRHADEQIDDNLEYIRTADELMLDAATLITRLSAELAEARAERDEARDTSGKWRKLCYQHEQTILDERTRATAAEAELAETKSLLAEARTEIAQMMHNDAEAECERLRVEVDRLREAWGDQEKQIDHYAFVLGKLRSRLNKRTRERDSLREALQDIAGSPRVDFGTANFARAALGEKADG